MILSKTEIKQSENPNISMSLFEEINVAAQKNELSYISDYDSKIANIKNGSINQGNRDINQSFISNEEFENLFHYNNNFSLQIIKISQN